MRRLECFGWILLTNAGFHDSRGFQFVRDSKSRGCWLLVRSNETGTPNPIALAEAPPEACQQDTDATGR
jgi:hypothetical protein